MLNILVLNCDDTYVEYEWDSIEDFVADMESDKEIIPMLDDALAEVNTDNDKLNSRWRDMDTVNDLYEECRLCIKLEK